MRRIVGTDLNTLPGSVIRFLLLASLSVIVPACGDSDGGSTPSSDYHLSGSAVSFSVSQGAGDPDDKVVILRPPLASRQALATWTASSDQSWLTVTPSSGTLGFPTKVSLRLSVQVPSPQAEAWIGATSTTSAPSAREDHDAAWTGSRMILWGGESSGTKLNSGGVYDPATDLWTGATSTTGAPSIRTLHTLVRAGSELIVWGGSTGSSPSPGSTYYGDGYRYSPATDTWLGAISMSNAPTARSLHTAVWTGSRMIIWGGYDGTNLVNTGGIYEPHTDTWEGSTSTVNAPTPRLHHVAVWTGTEMIIWGGQDGSGNVANGKKYDPVTDQWTTISSVGAPTARQAATAVWTGQEMVVWGGFVGGVSVDTGGRYDPSSDSWAATTTAGSPAARQSHSAVWTGSRMIVSHGAAVGGAYFNTGGIYQPPISAVGTHTAIVSIQPSDAPALTILVTLTIKP